MFNNTNKHQYPYKDQSSKWIQHPHISRKIPAMLRVYFLTVENEFMTCGNSVVGSFVDGTYSYSVHDASYSLHCYLTNSLLHICFNTRRDISISWAKPRVQKQTYFCFKFLQEHANFICVLHFCRKLSPIIDVIDVSLCKQHLHSVSKTYHRGVEPAHGRKLSCFTAGTQLHQAVGVSGIFNIGQAFAPGRGGHEPKEGKGSSQQQVLSNRNAQQCIVFNDIELNESFGFCPALWCWVTTAFADYRMWPFLLKQHKGGQSFLRWLHPSAARLKPL